MNQAQTMLQYASRRIEKLENLLVQADMTVKMLTNTVDLFGQVLCAMSLEAGMRGDSYHSQFRVLPPPYLERDLIEIISVMEAAPERLEEKKVIVTR